VADKEDEAKEKQQRFKEGDAVRYQGQLWQVSGLGGGPLAGYRYILKRIDPGTAVTADDEELEPWVNG
jgi:hypothetical protein